MSEFGRVCKRRKLKVNMGKNKVIRCRRREDDTRLNNYDVGWRGA